MSGQTAMELHEEYTFNKVQNSHWTVIWCDSKSLWPCTTYGRAGRGRQNLVQPWLLRASILVLHSYWDAVYTVWSSFGQGKTASSRPSSQPQSPTQVPCSNKRPTPMFIFLPFCWHSMSFKLFPTISNEETCELRQPYFMVFNASLFPRFWNGDGWSTLWSLDERHCYGFWKNLLVVSFPIRRNVRFFVLLPATSNKKNAYVG